MMKRKKIKLSQYVLLGIMIILAAACVIPLILVVVVSFSSEYSLAINGVTFFPSEWSLDGWKFVFNYGTQLVVSYGVTIYVTVAATLLSMVVESMFAYTLSRSTFRMRKYFAVMILITMMFSGGQVASYFVNVTWYHLKDTLLILVLSGVGAMHVIIMRTYIQGTVSEALIESAKMDGASEFRTYAQIVIPCMKPALASVAFMKAVGHWQAWNEAYLYITSPSKTPLALMLMKIETSINYILQNADNMSTAEYESMVKNLPQDSGRMALLLASLGPVLILYPFFQKHFVKGITIGSVKG